MNPVLQTVIISSITALLAASAPVVILFFLQRRGANKTLEMQQTSTTTEVFNAQTKAYSDLYDTAKADLAQAKTDLTAANNTAAALAVELKKYQTEREELMAKVEEQGRKIAALERADNAKTDELADARDKLERLRTLFTSVLARTGIQMTPEEQQIFEDTKPKWLITREGGTNAQ